MLYVWNRSPTDIFEVIRLFLTIVYFRKHLDKVCRTLKNYAPSIFLCSYVLNFLTQEHRNIEGT